MMGQGIKRSAVVLARLWELIYIGERVQNNDARCQAAAHAAARRLLPHPNFLQSASCHAVDGALGKTVEQDTVVELRQPRARSDVAHGDVSRIAAANAVHVSCSNALARV